MGDEEGVRRPSAVLPVSSSSNSNSNSTSTNANASITVTHSGPNIHTSKQYYEISPDSGIHAVERQSQLEAFELRKKARSIAVSTDDVEVRAHLRNLNHPMCLFGEDPADRRERLRQLLARLGVDALKKMKGEEEGKSAADQEKAEAASKSTWYHEGSEALLRARYSIAEYSLPRASQRLAEARSYRDLPLEVREGTTQELYKRLRPWRLAARRWATSGRSVRSASHRTGSSSPPVPGLASASSGRCPRWSTGGRSERTTSTPTRSPGIRRPPFPRIRRRRLGGLPPAGTLLATACYDHSWRLWDLGAGGGPEELLHQEGHSKGVHDVAFQGDGSLAASAGRDSFGRVWDLRTGRCIMFMEGHLKGIISVDFSPNGYQLVTGSEDNTVKIWNIRQRKLEYTIAAHTNVVSRVRFDRNTAGGAYIASASYDATVKLWASPAWTPIKTLAGHDGKVMGVDMSSGGGGYIASCSFDRTFKLWEPTLGH
ncbi:U4/U6 small nuclear ribonucleoprotein Prp4 [Tyrophagus putrescentiae]|nr:U4/U6 small nuclear ribonucleoprotein Prp4 [Tyrophagus putrescentiae]